MLLLRSKTFSPHASRRLLSGTDGVEEEDEGLDDFALAEDTMTKFRTGCPLRNSGSGGVGQYFLSCRCRTGLREYWVDSNSIVASIISASVGRPEVEGSSFCSTSPKSNPLCRLGCSCSKPYSWVILDIMLANAAMSSAGEDERLSSTSGSDAEKSSGD